MTDITIHDSRTTNNNRNYIELNAELNLWGEDHKVNYKKDKEAARLFFLNHVNPNTIFFHSLEEKLNFLVENQYYEKEFLKKYSPEFIKKLFKNMYAHKFRFPTFVGAYKFYSSYALKNFSGDRYLERFEDRIAITALYLAQGDEKFASELAEEMISGRFQPATPTFLNSGKASRGELVSCFLIQVSDDLNSIFRAVNSAAQLSKRGGGVALNLSNLRGKGDPIKKVENQSSGVVPVMKVLEDTFSYANQLGARQGAGAVYLNAFHWDILDFLDTKRENADEKIRIKTLSIGVVIPDILFELARNGEPMYLFSPYDMAQEYGKEFGWLNISDIYREAVDNPKIKKKKTDPRKFLNTLAELQTESGYPYILFEDAANRASNVEGKISMSNLCTEILQPQTESTLRDDQTYSVLGKDISCNLGSFNVRKTLQSPNFGKSVEVAIRALTQVSKLSDIKAVPTVRNGNRKSHSIGLGQMNLHGAFAYYHIRYGEEESIDLTNIYFYLVTYYALKASNKLAKEAGQSFEGFENSKYANGEFFEKFIHPARPDFFTPHTSKVRKIFKEIHIPTPEDWQKLSESVKKYGLYNSHLFAVPPTGSISYVNTSTSSIHPVAVPGGLVEARTEGKLGTVYLPSAEAEGNEEYFIGLDMFSIDPKHVIDVYSVAQYYVDQGLSLTLGYHSKATTKDIVKNYLYAFSKGKPRKEGKTASERDLMLDSYPQAEIKTLYYVRILNDNLEALQNTECVSCAL